MYLYIIQKKRERKGTNALQVGTGAKLFALQDIFKTSHGVIDRHI